MCLRQRESLERELVEGPTLGHHHHHHDQHEDVEDEDEKDDEDDYCSDAVAIVMIKS